MGKPIPLSQVSSALNPVTIPPVTFGASGQVANLFHKTDRFPRARTGSFKRPCTDDDPDNFFNLSLDYPRVHFRCPPLLILKTLNHFLLTTRRWLCRLPPLPPLRTATLVSRSSRTPGPVFSKWLRPPWRRQSSQWGTPPSWPPLAEMRAPSHSASETCGHR